MNIILKDLSTRTLKIRSFTGFEFSFAIDKDTKLFQCRSGHSPSSSSSPSSAQYSAGKELQKSELFTFRGIIQLHIHSKTSMNIPVKLSNTQRLDENSIFSYLDKFCTCFCLYFLGEDKTILNGFEQIAKPLTHSSVEISGFSRLKDASLALTYWPDNFIDISAFFTNIADSKDNTADGKVDSDSAKNKVAKSKVDSDIAKSKVDGDSEGV